MPWGEHVWGAVQIAKLQGSQSKHTDINNRIFHLKYKADLGISFQKGIINFTWDYATMSNSWIETRLSFCKDLIKKGISTMETFDPFITVLRLINLYHHRPFPSTLICQF